MRRPGHPVPLDGHRRDSAALTPAGLQYLAPATTQIPPPAAVFVRFRPGVEPQVGRHDLATRLAKDGSFTVDGPATPTDLLNFGQVQDQPQVLGIGLAAVALLTIAHLLITSVRRRRDFAILRALGFTSWQVFAHQLGITPVVAVPLAVLAVMAAVGPGYGACWSATLSGPNRLSGGARVAEPRAVWPPWPSGSRFRPATGASAPTPGSRASAPK